MTMKWYWTPTLSQRAPKLIRFEWERSVAFRWEKPPDFQNQESGKFEIANDMDGLGRRSGLRLKNNRQCFPCSDGGGAICINPHYNSFLRSSQSPKSWLYFIDPNWKPSLLDKILAQISILILLKKYLVQNKQKYGREKSFWHNLDLQTSVSRFL